MGRTLGIWTRTRRLRKRDPTFECAFRESAGSEVLSYLKQPVRFARAEGIKAGSFSAGDWSVSSQPFGHR